jgi:hypothetical protein
MAIIRKKYAPLLAFAIILGLLGIVAYLLLNYAEKVWNDTSTWSTEQRIKYPKESTVLRITNDTGIAEKNGEQLFELTVDYCYLYKIEKSSASTMINCSLLPFYYAAQAESVPKDWVEQPDIQLIIKPGDVEPKAFLNRVNKTYEFLSLGSQKYPVTMNVKGKFIRPEKTVVTKIQHLVDVLDNGASIVGIEIEQFSISPLTEASGEAKQIAADEWAKSIEAQFKTDFILPHDRISALNQRVNFFRTYFKFSEIGCKELSTCTPSYEENPAEMVAYYMYGLPSYEKVRYAEFMSDFSKQLFPFSPNRPAVTTVASGREEDADWSIFSVYSYPICPIAELVTGSRAEPTRFFKYHADNVFKDKQTTKTELLAALNKYDRNLYTEGIGWDGDFIGKLDQSCAYVLFKQDTNATELSERVVDVYFDMLSYQFNTKVLPTKESLASLIYSTRVLSPYKTPYLLDTLVMKDRAGGIETTKQLADSYSEWKSVLHTLIVLYVYEAL